MRSDRTTVKPAGDGGTDDFPGALRIDPDAAIRAVRAYNEGSYLGRKNVEVDRAAYERFRGGLPEDEDALVEVVRFVGENYGGAQTRFLPHSHRDEAALIVAKLRPVLDAWRAAVGAARGLSEGVPSEETLTLLLAPFAGTRRWPVWASKTLHFLRPDAFPIYDSRAKKALGLAEGTAPRDYHRFCVAFRAALLSNREALAAARAIDGGRSPSDLKLLDKILYQLGA